MPTNADYKPPVLTKQQKRAGRYIAAINLMLKRNGFTGG